MCLWLLELGRCKAEVWIAAVWCLGSNLRVVLSQVLVWKNLFACCPLAALANPVSSSRVAMNATVCFCTCDPGIRNYELVSNNAIPKQLETVGIYLQTLLPTLEFKELTQNNAETV